MSESNDTEADKIGEDLQESDNLVREQEIKADDDAPLSEEATVKLAAALAGLVNPTNLGSKRTRENDDETTTTTTTTTAAAAAAAASDSAEGDDDRQANHKRSASELKLKWLVTSKEAGSIIGRGGSGISEILESTNVRLRVSPNQELHWSFPMRVAMAEGAHENLKKAMKRALEMMRNADETQQAFIVRFIIPSSFVPAVIGSKGSVISELNQKSGARGSVSRKEDEHPVFQERILTVNGNLEQVVAFCVDLIDLMPRDFNVPRYMNQSTSYSLPGPYNNNRSSSTSRSSSDYPPSHHRLHTNNVGISSNVNASIAMAAKQGEEIMQLTLAVPDSQVGFLVGQRGDTLRMLEQRSGSEIKVAPRGEFVPGTQHRKVVVIGTKEGCQVARDLISAKLTEIANRAAATFS